MDASYKIQRGIHVHLIQFFMCPEFWVHIMRVPRFLCLLVCRAGSCTALRALQDASPVGLYAFFVTVFDLFRLFMNGSLYIFSV